jgi:hypothetical protein
MCGAGDLDSSLSIAVSAWNPRRMFPRASRSLARFCAFCHVCCPDVSLSLYCLGISSAYQDLVVSLSEACQPLLWVVWRRLLLLGGAAEEPHPLSIISYLPWYENIESAYEVHLMSIHPASGRCRWGMQGHVMISVMRDVDAGCGTRSSFETERVAAIPTQ